VRPDNASGRSGCSSRLGQLTPHTGLASVYGLRQQKVLRLDGRSISFAILVKVSARVQRADRSTAASSSAAMIKLS
jgi:hypothetical protein